MKANLTPTQPNLTKQTVQSAAELQVQIHQRAHELYEERGRQSGHELHDWLQAEAELTGVTGLKKKAVAAQ